MSGKTAEQPFRPRNAEQTRTIILAAARKCFSQQGYEQAGVRDIAKEAGINAALVIRYFGSKEQLFMLAVDNAFSIIPVLGNERKNLGERLARYLIKDADEDTFHPLLALLRSIVSSHGSLVLRQLLEEQFVYPLAAWLEGEQSLLRASLIASIMLGVAITRDVIEISPLIQVDSEMLIVAVAHNLQTYIDGMP